jgi:hypothetical protein
MGMPVQDFLGIVNRGWHVAITPEGSEDSENGSWRIEAVRVADAAKPVSFIDVTPVDGEVDAGQVFNALVFLNGVARVDGSDDDPQHQLVLAFLDADPSRPPPLPRGMHYAAAPDGSMPIADDRGTVLGSIARDFSMAQAGDAVVGAIAARTARGLVSKPSSVLAASSEEMNASAEIGNAEIDAMLAQLQVMPAERRPAPADPSAQDINRMKATRTAERQRKLLSEVEDARMEKGFLTKGSVPAATLAKLCADNGHVFRYLLAGGGRNDGYQIVDPGGALVASGSLKRPIVLPNQNRYLPSIEVRRLLSQIEDAELQNVVKGIPADAVGELRDSDEEIQKFADEHASGPDKPEDPDHDRHGDGPGHGPDAVSTGKR